MSMQHFLETLSVFYISPSMMGIVFVMLFLLGISFLFTRFPESNFSLVWDMFYEKIFSFFDDLLWSDFSLGTKTFIVSLFFIILFTNILGIFLDFLAPIFGVSEGGFVLEKFIRIPSADVQFNMALAIVSMVLLIYLQFLALGKKDFFLSYFPIYGKGYLELQKGSMNHILYWIVFPLVKIFDILISFFLSFLDIIGLFAKVISLSFRLFWNIVSGGVLLAILIVALGNFTESLTSFMGGIHFPVILPLIVYAQSLLIAVIQALVFSLLVAIFMKVSQGEN